MSCLDVTDHYTGILYTSAIATAFSLQLLAIVDLIDIITVPRRVEVHDLNAPEHFMSKLRNGRH